jgi:predicted kinase
MVIVAKLLLTRGLPASGKSTWAKAWVAEDAEHRARVNRDDTRLNVYGKPYGLSRTQEDNITKVQSATVETLLRTGLDVVVDDTNLNAKFAKDWLKLAAKVGADVEWHDEFLDVTMQVCLTRDQRREVGQVGDAVIWSFYNRYLKHGKPKRPTLDADALPVVEPYTGTPGKPKAFLVDIDGTIASNGTDRDHPNRGYFEWHRVGEDLPVKPIIDIVLHFEAAGLVPIFVSGRDGSCFMETRNWIIEHVYEGGPIWYDEITLHMRPEGDNRKDSIVKLEIFDNEIRDNYDVQFCLDDRDQVVAAYRSIGLTVLQVAPGDF